MHAYFLDCFSYFCLMKRRFLLLFGFLILLAGCHSRSTSVDTPVAPPSDTLVKPKPAPRFLGFDLRRFRIVHDTVRRNETFGKILLSRALNPAKVFRLTEAVKKFWDVRHIRAGRPYHLVFPKTADTAASPVAFVYEASPVDFKLVYLDSINGQYPFADVQKPVVERTKEISLPIRQSLFGDLEARNVSPVLALRLSEIYAWTVDFFHLFPGDGFKAVYTDKYTGDGRYLGIGRVKAAVFFHRGDTIYAFRYEFDTLGHRYDYFDEKGRSLRKQFLKSPLKFGRITSRYTMRRYVRIYGRIKPHLGTDFAAPVGTPIHATAAGYIEKIGYTRGNGNYIKIRHNSTYATQYLHMSRFAKGMRKGVHVSQGQVIGYVGMTGFTTGPHVCYRFWKNGRQVDPFKQKLPQAKSLDTADLPRYLRFIRPLKRQLDSLPYEKL